MTIRPPPRRPAESTGLRIDTVPARCEITRKRLEEPAFDSRRALARVSRRSFRIWATGTETIGRRARRSVRLPSLWNFVLGIETSAGLRANPNGAFAVSKIRINAGSGSVEMRLTLVARAVAVACLAVSLCLFLAVFLLSSLLALLALPCLAFVLRSTRGEEVIPVGWRR